MTRIFSIAVGIALFAGSIANAADEKSTPWVGTWAASPMDLKLRHAAENSTFRNIVHLSAGGMAVRVTLTNEFGKAPLLVGKALVAVRTENGGVSNQKLSFADKESILIPAGGIAVSDPLSLQVMPLDDLAVSIYLPAQTIDTPTCHQAAISKNYIFPGDQTAATSTDGAMPIESWCFLKDLQVQNDGKAAAIVVLGDSITDGVGSTVGTNHRWTDYLAARLQENRKTKHLSVLNQGIGGNRILFYGHGPSAASRFDRDVIAQPGGKFLILFEGINDIDQTLRADSPEAGLIADELISAATQMAEEAHEHNIKVFGATITPNAGIASVTPHVSEIRNAYNQWLRTSHAVDGVIDFDKAVLNPQKPNELLPLFDSGDHIHPSDAGYKAMADSINLELFR